MDYARMYTGSIIDPDGANNNIHINDPAVTFVTSALVCCFTYVVISILYFCTDTLNKKNIGMLGINLRNPFVRSSIFTCICALSAPSANK